MHVVCRPCCGNDEKSENKIQTVIAFYNSLGKPLVCVIYKEVIVVGDLEHHAFI